MVFLTDKDKGNLRKGKTTLHFYWRQLIKEINSTSWHSVVWQDTNAVRNEVRTNLDIIEMNCNSNSKVSCHSKLSKTTEESSYTSPVFLLAALSPHCTTSCEGNIAEITLALWHYAHKYCPSVLSYTSLGNGICNTIFTLLK